MQICKKHPKYRVAQCMENYISHTRAKCAQRVGMIRKIGHLLPNPVLKRIYGAQVRSVMEYGCAVWSGDNILMFQKLKDRFCRGNQVKLPLASNPGPHHLDLLDLREEGLGKLPVILESVKSMDRFVSPFFTLSVTHVPCYDMSRAYITGLQLVGFVSIDKAELSRRKSAIDKQSDSICNQTVDILRVRVSKSRFWCRF